MAAKQPAVGIDHVTVVPRNADVDEEGTAEHDGNDDGDGVGAAHEEA